MDGSTCWLDWQLTEVKFHEGPKIAEDPKAAPRDCDLKFSVGSLDFEFRNCPGLVRVWQCSNGAHLKCSTKTISLPKITKTSSLKCLEMFRDYLCRTVVVK